jgi:hypothetical protein
MSEHGPIQEIKKFEKDMQGAVSFFFRFLVHPLTTIEKVPRDWDWAVILIVVNSLTAMTVLLSCLLAGHSLLNTALRMLLFPLVLTAFQLGFCLAIKLIYEHRLAREFDFKALFILVSATNIPFILLETFSGWDFPVEYIGLTLSGLLLYRALKTGFMIPARLAKNTVLVAFAALFIFWAANYLNRSKTEILYEKMSSPQDINEMERDMQKNTSDNK